MRNSPILTAIRTARGTDLANNPYGLEGNFFNAWTRSSTQQEVLEIMTLSPANIDSGSHDFKIGGDIIHRNYQGTSIYDPVQLLRADHSLAGEIDFGPTGNLTTSDTELGTYAGDHWIFNGLYFHRLWNRGFRRDPGDPAAFSPRRCGVLTGQGRTIFRGGAGIFYDGAPLLAGDFTKRRPAGYPFDTAAWRWVFPHCLRPLSTRNSRNMARRLLPSGARLGSTPYNFTWNVEIDQEIHPHILARVSY